MAHTQSTDLTTPRQNAKETNNDNLKTNKMSKLEQRKCSIHGKTLVFCTHITQNSSKELQHCSCCSIPTAVPSRGVPHPLRNPLNRNGLLLLSLFACGTCHTCLFFLAACNISSHVSLLTPNMVLDDPGKIDVTKLVFFC